MVFDDNWDANSDGEDDQVGWVSLDPVDYGRQHRDLYYTDPEPAGLRARPVREGSDCEPAAPAPVAGVENVWIKAARLDCLGLEGVTDLAERDAVITSYYSEGGPPTQLWEDLEDFTSTCDVEIGVAWRNFGYQANFPLGPCP